MINNKTLFILTIFAVLLTGCNKRIENPDLVINEVMVVNEGSYTNDFGEKHAWIEIYNNTSRTQELSSFYITNDKNDPRKYPIPRGDIKTAIPPRQHVVFWADDKPTNGTFHLNFKLNPNKENYIGIFEADGKTVMDEIVIPAGMLVDKTYGYESDGIKYDKAGKYLGVALDRVTPSSNNKIEGENPKLVTLKETDPVGGILTITSMSVVFMGLLLLFLVFMFTGSIAKMLTKKMAIESGKVSADDSDLELSGEVLAAISAALHEMDQDVHDIESTILTIDEVKRKYSPWSSKIYTLRQMPK